MLKGQMLRALVSERLAAAAEDIFVLFERTIAEYEEELSRSKEENHRKQQILDQLLTPRIQLVRKDLQVALTSPDPGLKDTLPETSQMTEEQSSVKQEEEQLPVCVPESSAVCVKTEESSLLQQRQSEQREKTQRENRSSEPHVHSETVTGHTEHSSDTDTDNDDDWEPSSSSAAQMETEANNNQVQSRDRSAEVSSLNTSAPQNTDYNHMSEYDRKKYQCPVCARRFKTKQILNIHLRLHTGEGFSCSFCEKIFPQKSHLVAHIRTHTGEKPFSCFFCNKGFAQKSNLVKHSKTHTVENTYKFTSICGKSFPDISGLDIRLVQD